MELCSCMRPKTSVRASRLTVMLLVLLGSMSPTWSPSALQLAISQLVEESTIGNDNPPLYDSTAQVLYSSVVAEGENLGGDGKSSSVVKTSPQLRNFAISPLVIDQLLWILLMGSGGKTEKSMQMYFGCNRYYRKIQPTEFDRSIFVPCPDDFPQQLFDMFQVRRRLGNESANDRVILESVTGIFFDLSLSEDKMTNVFSNRIRDVFARGVKTMVHDATNGGGISVGHSGGAQNYGGEDANTISGKAGDSSSPEMELLRNHLKFRFVNFKEIGTSGVLRMVNKFVSDKTHGRISKLLDPSTVNSGTRAVFTTVVYFKAPWKKQFEQDTRVAKFNALDVKSYYNYRQKGNSFGQQALGGKSPLQYYATDVDMMNLACTDCFGFYRSSGVTVVSLPFKDESVRMIFFVPDMKNVHLPHFEDFWAKNPAFLDELVSAMDSSRGESAGVLNILRLPKFELVTSNQNDDGTNQDGRDAGHGHGGGNTAADNEYDILSVLKRSGIDAFDHSADFSRLSDNSFFVQSVRHAVFLRVSETGCEAAASAAATLNLTSVHIPLGDEISIDRPFLFQIRVLANQFPKRELILLQGRVLHPIFSADQRTSVPQSSNQYALSSAPHHLRTSYYYRHIRDMEI